MQQLISSAVMRMTSVEIADMVEKRHDNVKRTIETLAEQGVISFPQIEEKPTAGRPLQFYIFEGEKGKRDSIVVVAQLSPEFTARLVDRWQELERQQVKQPTPQIASPLEDDLRGIAFIADSMRLPDSGKLGMFTKYCQANAQRLLPALPAYAIDAPSDSTTGSSEATEPITEIVKGITSAVKANQALWVTGLLEQKHREGSDGLQKSYWSVTQEGLKYGKNITSPSNARETQPHWYVSKKDEIRKIVSDYLVS